ncbi:MAG: hypothetical protein WA919_06260 [Coleofasciculaceae cyanobacterium]
MALVERVRLLLVIFPYYIACFLKIPKSAIVRIERWNYVLFVHRRDRGGQFISCRVLAYWIRRVTRMIQICPNIEGLNQLKLSIKQEVVKFPDRYPSNLLNHWQELLAKQEEKLKSSSRASKTLVG